jgi:hypothetical protein
MISEKDRVTEHKLDQSEKPRFMYEYWVTGWGEFPVDMLRHDSCWPATGEDAFRMVDHRDERSVKIRSYRFPTIGRWSSFSWSVGRERVTFGRPT